MKYRDLPPAFCQRVTHETTSYVKSCKVRSFQQLAAGSCFNALAQVDPARALVELESLPKGELRRNAGMQVISVLADRDPSVACDLIEKEPMPGGFGSHYAGQVFAKWAKTDPVAAEKYYPALPEAQRDSASLADMMERYSNLDPQKAFDFAISLQNPQEQIAAVNGLFSNWSREDPEAAAAGWKKLPAGQNRLEALDQIAESWGNADPASARQWVETLNYKKRQKSSRFRLHKHWMAAARWPWKR